MTGARPTDARPTDARSPASVGRAVAHRIGAVLLVVGSFGVPAAAALPWLRTGSVRRSAYALARSARNLGLVDGPFRRGAFVALVLTPLLTGIVVLLFSLGRRRTAALIGGVIGVIGVAGAVAGRRLPGNPEAGLVVSLVAGLLTGVGSLVTLLPPAVPERRTTRS